MREALIILLSIVSIAFSGRTGCTRCSYRSRQGTPLKRKLVSAISPTDRSMLDILARTDSGSARLCKNKGVAQDQHHMLARQAKRNLIQTNFEWIYSLIEQQTFVACCQGNWSLLKSKGFNRISGIDWLGNHGYLPLDCYTGHPAIGSCVCRF